MLLSEQAKIYISIYFFFLFSNVQLNLFGCHYFVSYLIHGKGHVLFFIPLSPFLSKIPRYFLFFTGRQKYIRRTEKNRKEIYTVTPTSREYTQYHLDTNFRLYLHRDTRKKERTTDLKVLFEASRTFARPSGVDLKKRVGQICL